jgi:hypothetical protein
MLGKLTLNTNNSYDALKAIDLALRGKVLKMALSAAAVPITERAKELAPDGDVGRNGKPPTNPLQTATAAARFEHKLNKVIKYAVRLSEYGGYAVLGGDSKKALFMNIDFSDKAFGTGRKHVLWGKKLANPENRVQKNRFMDRAFDEKISSSVAIFEKTVAYEIDLAANG